MAKGASGLSKEVRVQLRAGGAVVTVEWDEQIVVADRLIV
jgi:hypothetical protein